MINKKNIIWLKYIIISICLLINFLACVIIIITASYTVPNTDDFSEASVFLMRSEQFEQNVFLYAADRAIEFWHESGGPFFTTFFLNAFNPLNTYNFGALRILMVALVLYFVFAVLFFLYSLFSRRVDDTYLLSVLVTCNLWSFFNYKSWPETLFWYTGAVSYLIPLGSLLLSVAFLYRYEYSERNIYILWCVFFGLIGFGGNQSVAIAGLLFYAVELVRWINKGIVSRKRILIIVVLSIFSMLNLLAPGNFVRASGYAGGFSSSRLVLSGLFAIRKCIMETEILFKDTGFIIVILVCFFCGCIKERCKDSTEEWITILEFLIIHLGIAFVACYGYNSPYLPNRTLFVADFFLICGFIQFFFQLGIKMGRYTERKVLLSRTGLVFVWILVVTIFCLMPYRLENGVIYNLSRSLVLGNTKNYNAEIIEILNELKESSDKDVVISLPTDEIEGFLNFILSDDENYFVNRGVANYFGKDSVKCVEVSEYANGKL